MLSASFHLQQMNLAYGAWFMTQENIKCYYKIKDIYNENTVIDYCTELWCSSEGFIEQNLQIPSFFSAMKRKLIRLAVDL